MCKWQSGRFAYTKYMVLQVSLTGWPFKNAVSYENSVFPTTSLAFSTFLEQQVSLKSVVPLWKLARRLDETHGPESASKHRFTQVYLSSKDISDDNEDYKKHSYNAWKKQQIKTKTCLHNQQKNTGSAVQHEGIGVIHLMFFLFFV